MEDEKSPTFMLLLRQHENRKHQLRRQHRLDKHPPRHTRIRTQRRPHIQRRRKHDAHEETRKNAARHLRREQQPRSRC